MTRLLLRVSFLSAVLLASSAATSRAAWPIVVSETVYTPASSILTVPTAYVVPTSVTYSGLQTYRYRPTSYYLTESSYVLPRRYYRPTAYYLPRSYVTSSLVDYAVTPTSYYLPTTWDAPIVTSSASNLCCDVQPACDSVAPAAVAPQSSNANTNTFTPDNSAANEPGLEDTNKVIRSSPANAPKATPPVVPQDSSVGGATEEPEQPATAAPAPAETDPDVPTTPAPDNLLAPPATPGVQHEVQRPIYPASSTARSTLRGKIVSATDGKPEKGVTVTLADARGRFKEKTRVTDADGTFSVVLPEGDWAILVPSVDGKGVIERAVTVSGGLITDDKDTAVSVLTLNR